MSSELDPAKLKVVDLRNELAARGLDQKGVKAVLVKRLKDYLDKEAESKGGKSENLVTKAQETPRKSARKSADEKEEVKSTKTSAASPIAEKGKPQEKAPQETPAPAKPDEPSKVLPSSPQNTAEVNSNRQSVSIKVPETDKKIVAPVGPPKTVPKPKDETLDKPKSSEKPISEVKHLASSPVKVKPAGDTKIEAKSPEKPKIESKLTVTATSETKSQEKPKSEVKSPEKPKTEAKSPEKPKTEAKSPEKEKPSEKPKCEPKSPEEPKSEIKSPDKSKSEVKELEKPINEDKKQEKCKNDETLEEPQVEGRSNGDASVKNAKLDDISEDKDKPTSMEVQEESVKTKKTESKSDHRGEKRKRSGDSPDRSPKRQKTPPEDEPDIDVNKVQLSWYDSDLHLVINKSTFLSAKPLNDGAFGYAWAGARATHGVSAGKVYYEVKVTDKLKWDDFSVPTERFRLDRNKRDDRRHSRRSDYKSGRKSEDKSKEKSDKKEKKQDKKEESMEVVERDTNEEKLAEGIAESSDKKSDEKMETEEKSDEKIDSETKSDEKMETNDENSEEKDNEVKKDAEKQKDNEENKDVEMEKNNEEKDVDCDKNCKEKNNDEKEKDAKEVKKKIDENEDKEKPEEAPLPTHFIRIGWSIIRSSLQLGEDKNSYAYESSGKFVKNKEFVAYGVSFDAGSIIGAYLDISENTVTFQFAVNGELQPAIEIPKSELSDDFALYPHVLSRNYEFEVNFGEKEEPLVGISSELEGYNFISKVDNKVPGLKRPESRSDCEVLLMCGLPASGKTHWVNEHVVTNPDKNYTILGNNSILDKMTVSGEPLKSKYKGKWGVLVDRIQKCLNKLVSTAALRRRNYIIDQTNVFASAQSRKMRPFEGFKRKAVIVVVGDEEQARRQALKEVPDSTILGMKAAMVLPVVGDWLEEVSYVGVDEKEAKEIIKKYNEAGRAAGFPADKRRDNRRNDQGRHFQRRSGYQQSYQSSRRWDRPQRRDEGGSSWKYDSRSRDWRGSSYNQRSRDYYSQGSYDRRRSQYGSRSSGGDWGNSGGSNWGNRSQSTGWNQPTFRNYTQPWSSGANQNWSKYNSGGWQGYGNNWNSYGQQGNWNQAQQYHQSQQSQQTTYSTNVFAAQNQQSSQPYNAQEAWAQYARQYAQHQQMAQAAATSSQKR
ncbi:heterogeneous nuclear ribonucleoprotein U isoform X1 [Diorhabda sublineata]|uniref:heterogeneous nuclear ribonucleoprotein U isoform X1 n=1 Tax=Diorhabda sublineata TaxID=1163346 RepID=UPI0024E1759E|nr:heterogeneous nuclear ribonucleoprotein U isoform X1 [Diorhabda sublineata]